MQLSQVVQLLPQVFLLPFHLSRHSFEVAAVAFLAMLVASVHSLVAWTAQLVQVVVVVGLVHCPAFDRAVVTSAVLAETTAPAAGCSVAYRSERVDLVYPSLDSVHSNSAVVPAFHALGPTSAESVPAIAHQVPLGSVPTRFASLPTPFQDSQPSEVGLTLLALKPLASQDQL